MKVTDIAINKFHILILTVCFSSNLVAQQVLLYDDFNTSNGHWTLNSSDNINGFTTVGSGGENLWIVNNEYSGDPAFNVPNTNLQPAGINGSPRSGYLHIISRNYSGAGIRNSNYQYQIKGPNEIYMTRMTSDVNTVGLKDINFSFWSLNYAEGPLSLGVTAKSAVVFYSIDAGTTWQSTGFSMANDSIWGNTSLSLPSFSNQATLRFGFVFANPDTGWSPAFAVDDIMLVGDPISKPNADFSGDKTLICKDDCVQFTDSSTGRPTEWKWDFGTGIAADTSNLQNPQFCFNKIGNYAISLTGTNSLGAGATTTKTGYIQVVDCLDPPDANFGMNGGVIDTVTICSGSSVSFADSSMGVISNRYWSITGGENDSGRCRIVNDTNKVVSVKFPCAGSMGRDTVYVATLNVSGAGGADFITKHIRVKGCVPAKARIKNESQRKICKDDCIQLEYDYSVKDEFFIQTELMTFKWYIKGIKTDQWDSNYYSYFIEDPNAKIPSYKRDSTLTGDVMNLCFTGGDNGISDWDVTLIAENIYGSDTVVYKDFVSVMGRPYINTIYDDSAIIRGHRGLLSVMPDRDVLERNNCKDLRGVEKVRGDTCCCFNYFWLYKGAYGVLIRDEIENWKSRTTYVEPLEDTWYYIIKENYNGCRSIDSLQITLRKDVNGIQYSVGVPDIFSPGSGRYQNKNFYVFGNGITEIDVKIYNRFGQLVYETQNVDEIVIEDPSHQGVKTGWKGTYQNELDKELIPGVYIYNIKVVHENGVIKNLQGNVTLVR